MRSPYKNPEQLIHKITLAALIFTVCIGAVLVLVQIKPFWVDEWFIIDSLKTKDAAGLFGQLDFMQQFPRVYLVLIKAFTSFFNYSYFSLRLPSYVVSVSVIILSYKMMKRIYGPHVFARYLFVLILISSFTYTEYFVEMKQYPMDIFMSIVALSQLSELLRLKEDNPINIVRYVFLCAGFLIVPFFSYTYLIAIVPAYVVVLLQTIRIFKSEMSRSTKWRITIIQWVPMVISVSGIFLFYLLDARQLATDKIMYDRWSFLIINDGNKLYSFFTSFYTLFSQTGNGLVFETLFGVLGISGFIFGIVYCIKSYLKKEDSLEMQMNIYSCLLLVLTLILFLCKKLPLGTPRLNAFTTPSIAILIIYLINRIALKFKGELQKILLPAILYIGVVGNVFTHYINYFTSPIYKKQMSIYTATENAIRLAQDKKIPILITTGVAYPYERATADAGAPAPAVWVLKTFPAYDERKHIPVYAISDMNSTKEFMTKLPGNIITALAGDGITFQMIDRD